MYDVEKLLKNYDHYQFQYDDDADTWYSWVRFFFHFTNGTQKNLLNELVLLWTQNICERWRYETTPKQ